MSRVDALITQLDLLNEKAKRTSKRKISEQECRKVYDAICVALPEMTLDERVDIHLAFEDRESLIEALVEYMSRLTQEVKRFIQKDKRQEALAALRQVLIADAIVDGRTNLDDLQKLQNDLLNAAKELHFDFTSFLHALETPAAAYLDRAYHFSKQRNQAQAIRSLGRALQIDHTLGDNPKIGEFATALTGEPPYSAIVLLEDSFLRHGLIQDIERKRKFQQAKTQEARVVRDDGSDSLLQRMFNGGRGGKRS
jgi:hypothetical protein